MHIEFADILSVINSIQTPHKGIPTLTMTNFKATCISLVLVIGSSAAGFYPVYSPGSANVLGTSVSQSITTTTPLAWTACAVGGSCPTGWTQTGGVSTAATYNFVCNSPYWCSNSGYAPGGFYSDLAWTKEAAACSVS
jgi:hypothetical protein